MYRFSTLGRMHKYELCTLKFSKYPKRAESKSTVFTSISTILCIHVHFIVFANFEDPVYCYYIVLFKYTTYFKLFIFIYLFCICNIFDVRPFGQMGYTCIIRFYLCALTQQWCSNVFGHQFQQIVLVFAPRRCALLSRIPDKCNRHAICTNYFRNKTSIICAFDLAIVFTRKNHIIRITRQGWIFIRIAGKRHKSSHMFCTLYE